MAVTRRSRLNNGRSAARGKRSKNRRRSRALALLVWQEANRGLSDQGHRDLQILMERVDEGTLRSLGLAK